MGFYHGEMCPKDADRMENSVDCDQTAFTDMSVQNVGPLWYCLIEPVHDKTNKMTFVPSEDSEQPRHSPV